MQGSKRARYGFRAQGRVGSYDMGGPLAAQAAPEGPSSGVMESPGSPGKRKRVAAGPLDAWELDAAAGEGRLLRETLRACLAMQQETYCINLSGRAPSVAILSRRPAFPGHPRRRPAR